MQGKTDGCYGLHEFIEEEPRRWRAPVTATGKTAAGKKPSAEVHHAAAAHHAAAQHHHTAAAHELNEGNPAKAKKHAKAAADHSRTANSLGDEIIVFYEVWEI